MSQLYEKDGVTPWNGRDSQGALDYGIKYENITIERAVIDLLSVVKLVDLEREIVHLCEEVWRQGYERGRTGT